MMYLKLLLKWVQEFFFSTVFFSRIIDVIGCLCWTYFQVVIRFDIVTKEVNWIIDIRGITGIFFRRLNFFRRIRFDIVTNDIIWVIDIKGIIGQFFQMADFFCGIRFDVITKYVNWIIDIREISWIFLRLLIIFCGSGSTSLLKRSDGFPEFFPDDWFFPTAVSIGLITCCVCVGEMYVRAPACAAVCIVGPDCVVEFFEVATDAFNALLSVGCFDSVVGTFSRFTTLNDCACALSLSTSFIFLFLFWWSYIFWHV